MDVHTFLDTSADSGGPTSLPSPPPSPSSSSTPTEPERDTSVVASRAPHFKERTHRTTPCVQPEKTPLEALQQDFAIETAGEEEEVALVDIGPSSTSARWARMHQGYALSYHLVETSLEHTDGMGFAGIDSDAFRDRLNTCAGRVSEMGPNHELLALGFMVLGTQLSSHTIIFGRSAPPTSSYELGLRRREPIAKLLDTIVSRIDEHGRLPLSAAEAVDYLALSLMALEHFRLPDYTGLRSTQLSKAFSYGVALLEAEDLPDQLVEPTRGCLQALAHHRFLGHTSSSATLYEPDDTLLSILFIAEEALLPTTSPTSASLHYSFFGSLEAVYDHLDYVLTYTPHAKTLQAVEYVWRRLDNLAMHYNRQFNRIYECSNLAVLVSSQLTLVRLHPPEEYLSASGERIYVEISRLARQMRHLPEVIDRLMLHHVVCSRLSRVLDLVRSSYLSPWSEANPEERDMLLIPLRLGASYLPEAARLVQLLETGDPRYAQWSAFPPAFDIFLD
ncbi:hypothetical protein JCM8097_007472 [Rhodosporidiobolus ruineniae]